MMTTANIPAFRQSEVARKTGLSQQAISKLVRGVLKSAKYASAVKLAAATGTAADLWLDPTRIAERQTVIRIRKAAERKRKKAKGRDARSSS